MTFNQCFPVRGDLLLNEDGTDLLLTESGGEAMRQRIRLSLQIFRGSWIYDLNAGLPYFQDVLVAGANVRLVEQRFREHLQGLSGVLGVTRLLVQFDRAAQTIFVNFTVQIEGEELSDVIDFVAT